MKAISGILVVLALAVTAFWVFNTKSYPENPILNRADGSSPGSREVTLLQDSPDGNMATRLNLRHTRKFFSHEGKTVDEVVTSVCPAGVASTSLHAQWWQLDLEAIRDTQAIATSGPGGSLGIDTAPFGAEPIVWGTHPDYLSELIELNADDVQLDSSLPVKIRALDPSGVSIGDFSVTMIAREDQQDRSAWLLRDYHGASGEPLVLPRCRGEVIIIASATGYSAMPWRGVPGKEVVLQLHPAFSVHGVARVASSSTPMAGVQVSIRRKSRSLATTLRSTPVSMGGNWGIEHVPLLLGRSYVLRLDGGGLVPQEVDVGVPSPGDDLTVDFDVTPGRLATVLVTDNNHLPIPGAEVEAWWEATSQWRVLSARSEVDGRAHLRGLPSSSFWIRARSPKYSYLDAFGPFVVDQGQGGELVIELSPGGRLAGRVRAEGVSDFDVTVWEGPGGRSVVYEFIAAESGEFIIENAPLGEHLVYATSAQLPKGDAVPVVINPADTQYIELTIPKPISASGTVIDALTNDPVPEASVQVYTIASSTIIRPWGSMYYTDQLGQFQNVPISPAGNGLEIKAAGYASVRSMIPRTESSSFRCEQVLLHRQQPLVVKLSGGGLVDYSGYTLGVDGVALYEARPFQVDGSLAYAGVSPGEYTLRLHTPEGHYLDFLVDLIAGKVWNIDIPIRSGRELLVRLRSVPSDWALSDLWVSTRTLTSQGALAVQYLHPDAAGTALFESLFADHVSVEVFPGDSSVQKPFYSKQILLDADGASELDVSLDGRSRGLQLFNPAGEPLAAVRITLHSAGDYTGWYLSGATDSVGEFDIPLGASEDLFVSTTLESLGVACDLPLPYQEGTVELVVDATESLKIRVVDNDEPLPSVDMDLRGGVTHGVLKSCVTNGLGTVVLPEVDPGSSIEMAVKSPHVWPTVAPLTVGTQWNDVQVRRRGSVEFTILQSGAILPGALLQLHSEEFDTQVSSWLESGSVQALPEGMTSNSEGKIRIDGLPNGNYTWVVAHPAGASQSGSVQIAPQDVTHVTVLTE